MKKLSVWQNDLKNDLKKFFQYFKIIYIDL
jgi:hypothetical protein